MAAAAKTPKAPSVLWTLAEGRAVFEFSSFLILRQLLKRMPKGDGHSVLVLPGFLASDSSTAPLRGLLGDLGYAAHGWGLGANLTFNAEREKEMVNVLKDVYNSSGRKISIVGWSLGGVFARELAKMYPDYVRNVISLGSPIATDRRYTNARKVFEVINGKPTGEERAKYQQTDVPPPVPTTSVYTKTDGVVHWHASLQPETPLTENIQVRAASHFGLGVNPAVSYVIADRLSQQEESWSPFKRPRLTKPLFPASPRK